jgi:H+/Cl- antiporter ClcA
MNTDSSCYGTPVFVCIFRSPAFFDLQKIDKSYPENGITDGVSRSIRLNLSSPSCCCFSCFMKAKSLFLLYAMIIGIAAGFGGVFLSLLLHGLQHLAFGYGHHLFDESETFLAGVSSASVTRRSIVLTVCGVLAGVGWWAMYRFGAPLVTIKTALRDDQARFPRMVTVVHACLQVMTVALGSPLGRETAPREIGALAAGLLTERCRLTGEDRRILIACGAGAGLAAVYNVPLAAVVFTLETLVCSFRQRVIIPVILSSGMATLVARWIMGNTVQYHIPLDDVSNALLGWALVCGPVLGAGAFVFRQLTSHGQAHAPRQGWLPVLTLLNFIGIAAVAVYFPQILGNGKGPAQISFDNQVTIGLALILLVLKVASVWSTLRCGARGGLLTPGIATGALLATVLGGLWNMLVTGSAIPLGGYAVVGAAGFLATSMQMPLTAIILMLELTHAHFEFVYPMVICVGGSVLMHKLCLIGMEASRRPTT